MIQRMISPDHINSIEWSQATGYARQVCAQVFRDGGSPGDALKSQGLTSKNADAGDWGRVVELIAQSICTHQAMRSREKSSTDTVLKKAA